MAIIVIPPIVIPTGFSSPPTPVNEPDNWALTVGVWGTSAVAVDEGLPSGAFATSGQSCIKFFPSVGHNTRIDSGWIAIDTFEHLTALGRFANKSYHFNFDFNVSTAGASISVAVLFCSGGSDGRAETIAAANIIDTAAKSYAVDKWNRVGSTFQAPAAARWMKFAIQKSDGGWTGYIDNITIKPAPTHMIANRVVNQSIPNVANQTILFDSTHSSSGVSINNANGTATIEEAGLYSIDLDFTLQNIPQSTRVISYLLGLSEGVQTTYVKKERWKGDTGSDTTAYHANATRLMNVGDTVYGAVYQQSGSAKSLSNNNIAPNQLAIVKING